MDKVKYKIIYIITIYIINIYINNIYGIYIIKRYLLIITVYDLVYMETGKDHQKMITYKVIRVRNQFCYYRKDYLNR